MQKIIHAFDFDGTITTRDTLVEFIRFARGGRRMMLGFLIYSPLLMLMKLRLYPNYKAKQKIFAHFFAGMPIGAFDELCSRFAAQNRHLLRPAAIGEIERARQRGETVIVVSASIDNWVAPFFTPGIRIAGTQIEVGDGIITGRFKTPNCYGSEKVRRIEQLFPDRGSYHLAAYGDSRGDREMLEYADERHYKPFRDSPASLLLVCCAAACLGAHATAAAQQLSPTAVSLEKRGYVNVQDGDSSIHVSLMYARADNFTGRVLYGDLREAYLHPIAMEALKKAQKRLKKLRPDLSIKVYDAARPMAIQQKMWDAVKHTGHSFYVSNPANGGGLHNYGLAVDITLCTLDGDTVPMGTKVDNMNYLSHIDREETLLKRGEITREAYDNRRLLRQVMRYAGWKPLRTEWWHFNIRTRAQAKRFFKVIK